MYNISNLNDLLVPELQDIASELKISDNKKLNKQDLIEQILQKQNNMTAEKSSPGADKPKRKRMVKPTSEEKTETVPVKEEKVEEEIVEAAVAEPVKKAAPVAKNKKPEVKKEAPKKAKPAPKKEAAEEEEEEELHPITDEETTVPSAIAQMLQQ